MKTIENFDYRPLSRYKGPERNTELEVVSKTHGKFLATAKYEDSRWGNFICWIDIATGEEIPADKETDLFRVHEKRYWKYTGDNSIKNAPTWFHFLWGVWRIRVNKEDKSLHVKNISGMKTLCTVNIGDTLYLGDEIDKYGNLYPAPYVKKQIDAIKNIEFSDEARCLHINEICLYMSNDYLYVCKCIKVDEESRSVTIENISNYDRYILKFEDRIIIINGGLKIS